MILLGSTGIQLLPHSSHLKDAVFERGQQARHCHALAWKGIPDEELGNADHVGMVSRKNNSGRDIWFKKTHKENWEA